MPHLSNLSNEIEMAKEHGRHSQAKYAGKGTWEAEIKKQEQLLHTRVWKGQKQLLA